MDRTTQLSQAIEKLSQKKEALTVQAIEAKREFDRVKSDLNTSLSNTQLLKKQMATIEEFNDSVKLLTGIFEASRFDQLALFIANPVKILGVNLFIGIARGLGFAVGVLVVAIIIGYLIRGFVGPSPFSQLIQSILSAF